MVINHIGGSAVSSYTSLLEKCQKKMNTMFIKLVIWAVFLLLRKKKHGKCHQLKPRLVKYYNIPVCDGLFLTMGKSSGELIMARCILVPGTDGRTELWKKTIRKFFFQTRFTILDTANPVCVSFATEYKKNKSTGGIFIGMK